MECARSTLREKYTDCRVKQRFRIDCRMEIARINRKYQNVKRRATGTGRERRGEEGRVKGTAHTIIIEIISKIEAMWQII